MKKQNMKNIVQHISASADVMINGHRPWDIHVNDNKFYHRVLYDAALGFGESYMDGWWECDRIDEMLTRIFRTDIESTLKKNSRLVLFYFYNFFVNRQSTSRAFHIGKVHYDIGNDLYKTMLDTRMVYTCGYWKNAHNLDDAQEAKLDLVCQKIGLQRGMTVLDIGCGWGSFAKFAAERYGANVVGITVSKEQKILAQKMCARLPVDIRLQDYRDIHEKFDRVVSLGMFEHVGEKNYQTYMKVIRANLNDDGLFLLHTIGGNTSTTSTNPWIEKYIFPNSMLPSIKQIGKSIEKLFVMEDWHNFSADYDQTLLAWYRNFHDAWDVLQHHYDERFKRMWTFYLLSSAASFRARKNQLWQIVLSPKGISGGYTSRR